MDSWLIFVPGTYSQLTYDPDFSVSLGESGSSTSGPGGDGGFEDDSGGGGTNLLPLVSLVAFVFILLPLVIAGIVAVWVAKVWWTSRQHNSAALSDQVHF